jgi:predicted RNA-binding protein (virulence factor B family)
MVPALEVGVNRDLMIKSDDKLNSRFTSTGDVFSVSINLPKRTSVFATPSIKLQNNIVDVDLSYTLEKRGAVSNHLGCVKVKLKF